uniref:Copper transport protein n=2 Tax=Dunaliella tertiolecta TaxID=3047 RepID=A0A6S8KSC7_DUNTE|mmetsp:Transcript_8418/g.22473  ORF Transcript_8418/g.22473 Transcript_8418/m.22473 type:complete len:446 (+) Transcript_8418:134-1471(+)
MGAVVKLAKTALLFALQCAASGSRETQGAISTVGTGRRGLLQHGSSSRSGGNVEVMAAPDNCYETPTKAECEDYQYPESRTEGDIGMLCNAMPDMPGCSLWEACKENKVKSSNEVCNSMVVLATICEDMPGMGGCKTYNTMCGDDSVIRQCDERAPVRRMPTWAKTREAMFEMCEDHPMEQCDDCTESSCPDPLASLSGACKDMPDMSQCTMYDRWCQANDDGQLSYYCEEGGGSSSGLPSMLMYFHKRVSETVLWPEWVPRTNGDYAGTIVAVFFFGIFSIGIKTGVSLMSIYWKSQAPLPTSKYTLDSGACHNLPWWIPRSHQWWQNAIKSVLMGISILLDYWNMLIAMTFNVGLFCAVILGYVLGVFFFASFPENYAMHLQMMTPPKTSVDCECPSNMDKVVKEGAEDTQALKTAGKSCCKASQQEESMEGFAAPACCPEMP